MLSVGLNGESVMWVGGWADGVCHIKRPHTYLFPPHPININLYKNTHHPNQHVSRRALSGL